MDILRRRNPNGHKYMTACSVLLIINEKQVKMTIIFTYQICKHLKDRWYIIHVSNDVGQKYSDTILEGVSISMFLESNLVVSIQF